MGKLWIEDEHVRLDNGNYAKAISPSIIAASRVTDIPAHYCDWFFHRLSSGYMACPTVGTTKKMYRYVSFANTQFIVFFSKNPRPLLAYIPFLKDKDIDFYINYTLNDYTRLGLEPGLNIEAPLHLRIDTFKRLSDAVGPERMIWHFDPLVMAGNIKIDTLMERISYIGEQLKGYTNRLVFGFLNVPKDSIVLSNLRAREIPFKTWTRSMKTLMVQEIARANKRWGFELATCSNADEYKKYGVQNGKCVDYHLIARLAWRNSFLMDKIGARIHTYDSHPSLFGDVEPLPKGAIMLDSNHYILQDEEFKKSSNAVLADNQCRCDYSFDIGVKGTCTYKCAYCFAAEPSYKLDANVKAHSLNVKAPSLTGESDEELRLTTDTLVQSRGIQLDRSLLNRKGARSNLDEIAVVSDTDPYYIIAKKLSGGEVVTVKQLERAKALFPDPTLIPTEQAVNDYTTDERVGVRSGEDNRDYDNKEKLQYTRDSNKPIAETTLDGEVIIDPEDEIDPFAQSIKRANKITSDEETDFITTEKEFEMDDNIFEDSKHANTNNLDSELSECLSISRGTDNIVSGKPNPADIINEEIEASGNSINTTSRLSQINEDVSSTVTQTIGCRCFKVSNTQDDVPYRATQTKGIKDSKSTASLSDIKSKGTQTKADINPKTSQGKDIKAGISSKIEDKGGSSTHNNQPDAQYVGERPFNALEYLQLLRDSNKYPNEEKVLEAFVRKVNSMVIGSNDEIIDGNADIGVSSIAPFTADSNAINEEPVINDDFSESQVAYSQTIEGESKSDNMPNTISTTPSDSKSMNSSLQTLDPSAKAPKPNKLGSSPVTDYDEVHRQILKAEANERITTALDRIYDFEENTKKELHEQLTQYKKEPIEQRTPTNDDFNSDMEWLAGTNRNSLRNRMKKK